MGKYRRVPDIFTDLTSEQGDIDLPILPVSLSRFEPKLGKDLCACTQLPCHGICRRNHTHGRRVVCPELYRIKIDRRSGRIREV